MATDYNVVMTVMGFETKEKAKEFQAKLLAFYEDQPEVAEYASAIRIDEDEDESVT